MWNTGNECLMVLWINLQNAWRGFRHEQLVQGHTKAAQMDLSIDFDWTTVKKFHLVAFNQ